MMFAPVYDDVMLIMYSVIEPIWLQMDLCVDLSCDYFKWD